jgi:hypothetical protein
VLRVLILIARHTAIAFTRKIGAAGSRRPGGTMVMVFFFLMMCCCHLFCESSRVEEVLGHWLMGLQLSNLNKEFTIKKTTQRICSFAVGFFHEFWAGHLIF